MRALQKAYDEWKAAAEKTANKEKKFVTVSAAPVKPLYTPVDIKDIDFQRDLGFPGEFPYTRGVHPSMYRGKPWTQRQFSGMGTPQQTNQRYHFLLNQGQHGLSVAFDLPTLMGYDSDHVFSHGEVGKCGVAVDTLLDMEIIFKGIDLSRISTSMTINAPAAVLLAMYITVGEKQGVPMNKLRGTLQNDILKEYIAQKEWIYPPEPAVQLIVDTIEFGTNEMPLWNTISISGYHIREAGSTAVQELAFTLADGFTYIEKSMERGLDVDDFAPRLSFFFNAHMDFFEEIAKYRAARRIYAKRMRDKYGAKNKRSWMLRFHTQTAGCSLQAQQPELNLIRTAYEAMSAALGGTQSLHTNSMDETLALPSDKAALLALRTQQVLAEETGVVNVIDPLAGSYYIEALTNRMEKECEDYFAEIDRRGGVLRCIEEGYLQKELARSAYVYQQEIDARERIIVGVNEFVLEDEEIDIPILKIDEQAEATQIESIKKAKSIRNQAKVEQALETLRQACRDRQNTIPFILDCVREYATLGEISLTMKDVYGDYKEPPII
ncbi:MAG: methylmalonyl-CoA mutase family protein [candidate division Zixibacteria bacterium]|nr:methylmalonyl-CoA mutase family protein [candidate division Zixibacteria bacterium]